MNNMTYSYTTTVNYNYLEYPIYSYTTSYNDIYNHNIQYKAIFEKEMLGLNNLAKTHIPQDVEEKLLDYVRELDKYFIQDIYEYINSHLQEKCYEIAEQIMIEVLDSEYCLSVNTDKNDIIDKIVNNISFDECYEILNDILNEPTTFEEKLRDIGMSMSDFI